MVTINPADGQPDRVYMGTVGGEREVLRRHRGRELPWESFTEVMADDDVSELVPLVEARPIDTVTRSDIEKAILSRGFMRRFVDDSYVVDVDGAVDGVWELLNPEGEQPVHQVEQKAAELWEVLHPARGPWGLALRSIREGTVHAAVVRPEVESVRRLARHVLGQEARDE